MITKNDFRIERIQASAFSYADDDLRPNFVLKYVLSEWAELYNAAPVSLPLSNEISEDFPSVILSSEDGTSRIEASRGRINVAWLRNDDSISVDLQSIFEEFQQRLVELFADQRSRIGRLAAIVVREANVENPGRRLVEQYCNERWLSGPLNRPDGFEIHAHKVFELLDEIYVNSWIRIKTAPSGPGLDEAVRVEQDLNTLAQLRDVHAFSNDQVQNYFARASGELDVIMSLYFPMDADNSGQTS